MVIRPPPSAVRWPLVATGGRCPRSPELLDYGVVVESVKVSALLYVPVRSASAALINWLNCSATGSLEIGPGYVSRLSGVAEEPTLV